VKGKKEEKEVWRRAKREGEELRYWVDYARD
jgi:hypothetical protein